VFWVVGDSLVFDHATDLGRLVRAGDTHWTGFGGIQVDLSPVPDAAAAAVVEEEHRRLVWSCRAFVGRCCSQDGDSSPVELGEGVAEAPARV
jgi:hypothetical protein